MNIVMRIPILLLLVFTGAADCFAQEPPSMHRGLFWSGRPFGALGFLSGSYSYSSANGNQRVVDLSGNACVSLPAQSEYWFILNHRNDARAGELGFFAIAISARSPSQEPTDDLRIHRNAGWVDASGRRLPEVIGDPSNLKIGADRFVELHTDSIDSSEESRRLELAQGIGEWHANPDQQSTSSWSARRTFATNPALARKSNEKLILGARLLKFNAGSSGFSTRPMVFGFNPSGMGSFKVSVSAPGFELFKQTTEIRIGEPCSGANQLPNGLFDSILGRG